MKIGERYTQNSGVWLPLDVADIQNEIVGTNQSKWSQLEPAVGSRGGGRPRMGWGDTQKVQISSNFRVPEMGGGFMNSILSLFKMHINVTYIFFLSKWIN